jgi:hypothetical protein
VNKSKLGGGGKILIDRKGEDTKKPEDERMDHREPHIIVRQEFVQIAHE